MGCCRGFLILLPFFCIPFTFFFPYSRLQLSYNKPGDILKKMIKKEPNLKRCNFLSDSVFFCYNIQNTLRNNRFIFYFLECQRKG